jgi:hypothetical protein
MNEARPLSTFEGGAGLSEDRKLTLLRRQSMTAEELEDEEEEDEDFWANVDISKMSRLDLKVALQSRGLSDKGSKKELRQRLEQSVEEEKQEELEFLAMVEAARRAESALEEAGSVYVVGTNTRGQLGVGHAKHVSYFTVIRSLRSKGIQHVSAGFDSCLALSEDGNLYSWGGSGAGPLGVPEEAVIPGRVNQAHLEPQLVVDLQGEGVEEVSMGTTHAIAVSEGGDMYTWGRGKCGQLGHGDYEIRHTPIILNLPKGEVRAWRRGRGAWRRGHGRVRVGEESGSAPERMGGGGGRPNALICSYAGHASI